MSDLRSGRVGKVEHRTFMRCFIYSAIVEEICIQRSRASEWSHKLTGPTVLLRHAAWSVTSH